jgi:cytochrome c-type biogenesis protein CcsB
MNELTWAWISADAFDVAIFAFLAGMVAYFASVAFRREAPWYIGRVLAVLGLGAGVASVIARGFAAQRVPWGNMYEYSVILALLTVLAYLVFADRRPGFRVLGGAALMFAVLTMAVAAEFFYVPPGPLVPALNSYWIKIHVVAAMSGSALFALGCFATMLFLFQDRRERRATAGSTAGPMPPIMGAAVDTGVTEHQVDDPTAPMHAGTAMPIEDGPAPAESRLPPAAALDALAYRIIAFAFPIWTFAVIAGALWAQETWGRYWGWDPKETWSFITWTIFAGYLHARATAGWRGRKAAWVAMVGFVSLLITYYAVNLWIAGLHSYRGF